MQLTLSSGKDLIASTGNSVKRLLSILRELKVSFTPKNTSLCNFCITFRSKLRAVKALSLCSDPGSIVLKLFWAKSKKAKPCRSRTAFGMFFNWQPFKLRFFSEVSRPLRVKMFLKSVWVGKIHRAEVYATHSVFKHSWFM